MKIKTTAWTPQEDAALAAAVEDNISAARMTVRLQRSEAAIKRRMRELSLIGKRRMQASAQPDTPIEPAMLVRQFLGACKTGDLRSLMRLFHPEATLECACTGVAVFAGWDAIQKYWAPKIGSNSPLAFSLIDLRYENGRTVLDYLSYEGKPVRMYVWQQASGTILRTECGPRTCTSLAA